MLARKAGPLVVGVVILACTIAVLAQQPPSSALHRAARTGDVQALRAELRQGADPNLRDPRGRTPLMDAAAGQTEALGALLKAGADLNARADNNATPLLEAAAAGQADAVRALISAGARLNAPERGWGTPLETAERNGHAEVAALLRSAGARSSGHSPGDTVCVRPWEGNGYCGVVVWVNKTQYRIRLTRLVGCREGCPAKPECSAGRPLGGPDGLGIGDTVDTVSWCLTDTGVKP